MKTIKLLLFSFLFTSAISAQDCSDVLFLKEGTALEYINYDKKGKTIGTALHTTNSVTQEGNKTIAEINMSIKNIEGQPLLEAPYRTVCENGEIAMDMDRFFDIIKLMEYQEQGMDMDYKSDILTFPVNMKEGDVLADASIEATMKQNGTTLLTVVTNFTGRNVVESENITIPAGTFNCKKVTYNFESKFGFITSKGSTTEWYDEKNRILVKSETYNKKGKLRSSYVLSAIK